MMGKSRKHCMAFAKALSLGDNDVVRVSPDAPARYEI